MIKNLVPSLALALMASPLVAQQTVDLETRKQILDLESQIRLLYQEKSYDKVIPAAEKLLELNPENEMAQRHIRMAEQVLNTVSELPIISQSTDAAALIKNRIAQGHFGELDLKEGDISFNITLDGSVLETDSPVYLVSPGDEVFLGVSVDYNRPALDTASGSSIDDTAIFRQTSYREAIWESSQDDYLRQGRDEFSIHWSPGASWGKVSTLTVSLAQLQIHRPATLTASPDKTAPASLLTGERSIFLLSGLAYDRNGDGLLSGQNIGIYPNEKGPGAPNIIKDRAELYIPPDTFYPSDTTSRKLMVTDYLTLGDITPPAFPDENEEMRLVALSVRLLNFLDQFEEVLIEKGEDPEDIKILRGFVSPTERRRLERQSVLLAEFTRFQYGDAVAMILDSSEDSTTPELKDINGDGTATIEDIEALAAWAKETMDQLGIYGGIGVVQSYEGPGSAKGMPYLHIDLRGWYSPFRE